MDTNTRRRGAALGVGLVGVMLLGCEQPFWVARPLVAGSDLPTTPTPSIYLGPLPSGSPPAATSSAAVARSTREVLPFNVGDRFTFQVTVPLLPLPVGKLRMVIQALTRDASGDETTDLTMAYGDQAPKAYQVILRGQQFHFDGKPFIPLHMAPGQQWDAQGGTARVKAIENLLLPRMAFPFMRCYVVEFSDQAQGMTLWFAPGVGLVKGTFRLGDYFLGNAGTIELIPE